MHSHPCTFCGQYFDCTAPFESNPDGWPEAVCVAQMEPNLDYQSCDGCRKNGCCESCEAAPATGDGHQPFFCGHCEDTWLDNYSGPSEPDHAVLSIGELSERAHQERAELRRRD